MNNIKISIIGLGYVGIQLALEFGKDFKTIGFDKDMSRVNELKNFFDRNKEFSKNKISKSKKLKFSYDKEELIDSNFFIIAVPTPLNAKNKPDLSLLKSATFLVSKFINKKSIIVIESTVYPGVSEEICLPILAKNNSHLTFNKDFFIGYSPERINPGDKKRTIRKIKKIVSASHPSALKKISKIYEKIIDAGVHKVSSIKVAESAKIIENVQRDVNIALINEFSKIFSKLEVNTNEVLTAASTKWNFHPYLPGLVGGHCIGIDPYYLTYLANKLKIDSKMIMSGRHINEGMVKYASKKLLSKIKLFWNSKKNFKILFMGLTFKENCADIRNSKNIELYKSLIKNKFYKVDALDPWVIETELSNLKIKLVKRPIKDYYDIIVIAVPHTYFKNIGIKKIRSFGKRKSIIYDIKNLFPSNLTDLQI